MVVTPIALEDLRRAFDSEPVQVKEIDVPLSRGSLPYF
jgi:hypothetical protein